MTAHFLGVSKRRNSTYVPDMTGTITRALQLKEKTDVVHPIFELQGLSLPYSYNYMYVEELNRYYFIDSWEYGGAIWYAHCTVDVLATYKTGIGQQLKYVLRSSSNPSIGVVDTFFPMTDRLQHDVTGIDLGWQHSFSTGWYVVGLIGHSGAGSATAGSVTYYVMSAPQLSTLVQYMLSGVSTTDWSDMTALQADIAKTIADPLQYIVSCLYFPYEPPRGADVQVTFGFWDVPNLTCSLLQSPLQTTKHALEIRTIAGYDWRTQPFYWGYLEPYSSYILQFNPFGTFSLPAAIVAGHYYLGAEIKTDFVSGMAVCNLYAHDDTSSPTGFGRLSTLVTSRSAQVGVQIQLSQNTSSLLTSAGNIIGGVTTGASSGFMMGGVPGAIVGGVLGGAKSAMTALSDSFVSNGSNGGISGDEGLLFLHAYRKREERDANTRAELGTTCYQSLQLSSLSGYVLCADGEITVNALGEEKQMLSEFLTTGFYME